MTLRHSTDVTAADWLVQSPTPWHRLVSLGPDGFQAYARLRFIPDPTGPGQSEGDVPFPDGLASEIARTRRVLHVLDRFTTTPDEAYFCLWEGHGDMELPPAVRQGPLVDLPNRRYALLRGAVADIDEWGASFGSAESCWPPAIAWPADRSWCFVRDVDPHFAGIAASHAAVAALLAEPDLDVVPAHPSENLPTYS